MSKATPETTIEESTDSEFKFISREEGIQLLDERAREYLGMSGVEFVRRYQAGEIEDPDRSDVIALAIMMSFAEL